MKKLRPLKNLIWNYDLYGPISYVELNMKQIYLSDENPIRKIHNEMNRCNLTWEQFTEIWKETKEYKKLVTEPKQQRKGETRDNKDKMVGNGRSNSNKIRYPKKKRKTAWKRFYKLFPHLKDK